MASETSICNSALIKLGADRIISLLEDNKRAQLCNEQYPKSRDALLRSHLWNFAVKRESLAIAAGVGPYEDFTNAFVIPADSLRILDIDRKHDFKFKVEGRFILTNETDMTVRYIAQITEVGLFDANFVEALAYRLAWDLAYSITQSNTVAERMRREFNNTVKEARTLDAQESYPDEIIASDWLDARLR